MVNAPEFNLNEPYKLNYEISGEDKKKQTAKALLPTFLNQVTELMQSTTTAVTSTAVPMRFL